MQQPFPKYKIAFVDFAQLTYDVTTPFHQPMGGSESALCYLAAELAARGHDVTIINAVKEPCISNQVKMVPNTNVPDTYFHQAAFDAVVVTKGPAQNSGMKSTLPTRSKLFLWTGHAADQPAVQGLATPQVRDLWDGVITVSQWQRQSFITRFGIAPERIHVLKNAISPAFENLFPDQDGLKTAKKQSLRLAYTSTPFRGLDRLLGIFQRLNAIETGAQLDIYSSMQVYGVAASADKYTALYHAAQNTPHVRYVGSIDQARLAAELKGVSILSYPNNFAETSCIAVMEAMAAGTYVITTNLGALVETTAGHGCLIALQDDATYAEKYLQALKETIDDIKQRNDAFIERQYEQVLYANRELTWKTRAGEWEALLAKLCVANNT